MINVNDFYRDIDATRALQASDQARQANFENMKRWGAYSLMKVTPRGDCLDSISNYVTNLPAINSRSPRQMERILGLKDRQLYGGADIYRLLDLPDIDGFLPRGYSTLVDGLGLKAGLKQDAAGYRPGLGAWQITLIKPVRANRVASLAYDEVFESGIHPSLVGRYR